MNAYIDLTFYAFIVVYIVDLSGFTDTWLSFLSAYTGRRFTELKPFSCSLCMMFWLGLLRLVLTSNMNLYTISFVCLLSFLTAPIAQLMNIFRELIFKILNAIGQRI